MIVPLRRTALQNLLSICSVGLIWTATQYPVTAKETDLPDQISFNQHIRPIFNQHCTACHGGVKQAADISFVYREQVLPPDGWIVEPGEPDESILLERVLETDPDLRMPPPDHGQALSSHETELLRQWIEEGAVWDASHWAYAAPKSPPIPSVSNPDWLRQPSDAFVMAKLDEKGLQPSADAAPERWLRRVSLDLTGLPPTPAQRDAFFKDLQIDPEQAYETVVDGLLHSPRYGERWASVWLDQTRYADSKGLGADGRRTVWKYRDWVIDAFNQDMPFDEFTIRQIAGDQLPNPTIQDLIATAAHRVTQSNEEGGTDDEEFRIAAVLDRVNTTWQAWQGITFGCVQCHSHPYDPFRHEEYYQFAAFFNNTADCDLNEDWPTVQVPLEDQAYAKATQLDRKIATQRQNIWQREYEVLTDQELWTPIQELDASTSNQTKLEVTRQKGRAEFRTVGTVSKNADFELKAALPADLDQLTGIRLTIMPHDPEKAKSDSEWGFVLSNVQVSLVVEGEDEPRELPIERLIIDEPEPFNDPQLSLDPKSNRGFAAYSRIHQPREAALLLKEPVDLPDQAQLIVTLKHRIYLLAAFSMISRRGHLAVSGNERLTGLLSDEVMVNLRKEHADTLRQRRQIKSVSIPIMRELPQHLARPTHVFERGLFLTKGQQVSPGTPGSLPSMPSGPASRLTMAKWLVSPKNPLTARVAVNRIWSQLYGVGIVATEEDFGSSGEPPSHPALLDFLAVRFQRDHGWSFKALLRELVLSRTYRQSSTMTSEDFERDPMNRLLARGPRHRLPSEVVRDQALALSGLLDDELYGPPVHPPIPDGVWKPFQAGDKWNVPEKGNQDRYRRSIYTYTKRSIPYPMFSAFDAPSREFCSPRRLRSNTPLQALMMLNDETFVECADALANRMQNASDFLEEQIHYGYKLATCREPAPEDVQDLCLLANEKEHALQGLVAVATVLLNLDEVVMK